MANVLLSSSTGYSFSFIDGFGLTPLGPTQGVPVKPNMAVLCSSWSSSDLGGVVGSLGGFGAPPYGSVGALPSSAGAWAMGTGLSLKVNDLVLNCPNTSANVQQPRLHIVTASTAHYSTSASSYAAGGFDITLSAT